MARPPTPARRLWLAATVAVVGLLLTALATVSAYTDLAAQSRRELALIGGEIGAKLQTRLHAHAQLLRSGAAFFGGSQHVSRDEWRAFVERSQIQRNLPGIQGIGFAQTIPPARLSQHVAEIRAQGFPDYRVWPPGERPLYTAIVYLEPFSGRNLRAFGYDMLAEPVRRAAMERARDEDVAALSGKVQLVQETDRDVQAGTLMYVPVYSAGSPTDTVEQRRAALAGWIYSPYRMADLMLGVLGGWDRNDDRRLHLAVYDGETLSPQALLYESKPAVLESTDDPKEDALRMPIEFNGTRWTLALTDARPASTLPGDPRVWLMATGGALVSLLLGALVLAALKARSQAVLLATELEARREAQAALRESEQHFRTLANGGATLIRTSGTDRGCNYVNEPWSRFTGRTLEQELGEGWTEGLHPEDRKRYEQTCVGAFALRKPFSVEYRLRHADGSYRWLRDDGNPRYDSQGAFLGYIGFCVDIDAHKRAETERERLIAQLRRQNAVVSGIGRIFREALTCRSEAALGRVCLDEAEALTQSRFGFIGEMDGQTGRLRGIALSDPGWEACRMPLGSGAGERPALDFEIHGLYGRVLLDGKSLVANDPSAHPDRIGTPPGHPPLTAFLGVPLRHGGETFGMIGLANRAGGYGPDDLRSAEALAVAIAQAFLSQRAEEALREADRRKDEFLATLAHELRNPLAPLRTGLEILRLGGPDPDRSTRALAMMDRQLDHLVRLVDDLLDLSRISRGRIVLRRERVFLADSLRQALEIVRPLVAARGHTLKLDIPDEPLALTADAQRLTQIFANLLGNAAKYTEPGGAIALSVAPEGGEAVVTVADNGIGIPPALLPRIFDMFVQDPSLEQGHSGLGIGLHIVRQLVAMHGGRVEARSPGRGQGSTFVVRLPLAEPEASEVPAPAADPPPELPGQGRRILVVDDNRDAADSLSTMLGLLGYEVHTAYDGVAALTLAAELRPAVIVLDLGMPAPDGYETAARIRSQPWGKAPLLVALTGWGQEEDRRRSRDAGFDRHLVKPVEIRTLVELLAGS